LELDDGPELAVDVEHQAVLEVVRGGHGRGLLQADGPPARGRSAEDEQLLGRGGEQLGRAVADDEGVLDAYATAPGKVDPGLDGDRRACVQATRGRGPEERRLVDLEADPVAQAVPERLPVAGVGDDGPGRPVDRAQLRAGGA